MRRLPGLALLLALGLTPGAALAGPFEDGQAAQQRSDFAAAAKAYEDGAVAGDLRSKTALAGLFFEGKGVGRDLQRTEALLLEATGQKYRPAAFLLARMYATGALGRSEPERARAIFQGLADEGEPAAAHSLALLLYQQGSGAADDAVALKYATMAAEAGMPDAQYHLGRLYHEGRGTAKDETTAYMWVFMAAQAGFAPAQGVMSGMFNSIGTEQAMSAEQRATALWQSGKVKVEKRAK